MKDRCICDKCGRVHRPMRVVDTVARAKAGAAARWGSQTEKLEAAKEALAEAPQPKVARTVKSILARATRTVLGEPYRCSMHRMDTKGCGYCDIEHGRMAND